MSRNLKRLILLVFIGHLFCLGSFAQTEIKKITQGLFAKLKEDENSAAECEQKARAYQIANFGRILPRISGHCFDGCPTRIVKPYYPNEAKRFRISGQVRVETIVDETGKVVYARAISGKPFLRQAAEQAAQVSSYQPKKTCGDKPIKFRWAITYNFILN
jgi:TonB family protein